MPDFSRLAKELLAVPPASLSSKARALNRVAVVRGFVDDDGLSPDEVEALYVLLARRLKESGVAPPSGGFYPLAAWATRALPAGVVVPAVDPAFIEDDALAGLDDDDGDS